MRRLVWAVAPTGLDARALSDAVVACNDSSAARRFRDACGEDPRLSWEKGLFGSFCADDVADRRAMLSEQLLDLDGRVQRWARVPRVGASVSTSMGFLLASLALIGSLGAPEGGGEATGVGPGTLTSLAVSDLASAVAALAVGVAGASFCIAAHVGSSRAVTRRLASIDRLTGHLEVLAELPPPTPAGS